MQRKRPTKSTILKDTISADTIPVSCLVVLVVLTIITGISSTSKLLWVLEAVGVWLFIAFLIITYKNLRMPNYIYILITVFLILPLIGGYYGFENVPYGKFLDFSNHQINEYNKLVHFSYGILITPFIYELLKKTTPFHGLWLYIMPVVISLAVGAFYELLEWFSAFYLSPEDMLSWVGLQGDCFDSQKDLFMGFIGSIISMTVIQLTKNRGKSKLRGE